MSKLNKKSAAQVKKVGRKKKKLPERPNFELQSGAVQRKPPRGTGFGKPVQSWAPAWIDWCEQGELKPPPRGR